MEKKRLLSFILVFQFQTLECSNSSAIGKLLFPFYKIHDSFYILSPLRTKYLIILCNVW